MKRIQDYIIGIILTVVLFVGGSIILFTESIMDFFINFLVYFVITNIIAFFITYLKNTLWGIFISIIIIGINIYTREWMMNNPELAGAVFGAITGAIIGGMLAPPGDKKTN
jgi:hypothetical protein